MLLKLIQVFPLLSFVFLTKFKLRQKFTFTRAKLTISSQISKDFLPSNCIHTSEDFDIFVCFKKIHQNSGSKKNLYIYPYSDDMLQERQID